MTVSISKSNTKTTCPSFNKACYRWTKGTTCHGCYALKSYHQYPNVRKAWDYNQKASLTEVCMGIMEYLQNNPKTEYFRIHSSGEFESVDEIHMWCHVARENPSVIFWGFSKEVQLFKGIKLPYNLKIRVLKALGKNYGDQQFISWALNSFVNLETNSKLFFQCPCGLPNVNNKSICGNRCKACMLAPVEKLPLFLEH